MRPTAVVTALNPVANFMFPLERARKIFASVAQLRSQSSGEQRYRSEKRGATT